MEIKTVVTHHFVKSEDLNHHGTLFAGRTAEWFVEAGLMATAEYLPPENIVCVQIHGMNFSCPIHLGETVRMTSRAVRAGRTSVVAHIATSIKGTEVLDGFITFVNVDQNGHPLPHGITLEAASEEEQLLQRRAGDLPRT